MKRLTEKRSDGDGYKTKDFVYTEDVIQKLAEYEGLEEQGLLLKLPCKIGDKVWVKMQFGNIAEATVRDYVYYLTCGFCLVLTSKSFNKENIPFSEIGKTVFLTKEEAEEALQRMKGI